jgi:transcriptional regulator with XRE-family HTH domain
MSKDARESLLRQRIAANMAHYRKLHNMTQSELAERISYSDKSISKWERAEGVPDIYVLALLAELFSVSVNDLISENAHLPPPVPSVAKNRVIEFFLLIGLVWLVATVTYTALRVFAPFLTWAWYSFIIAIPVSCILAVVLTSLWWGLWIRFWSVSALVWSIAASVYILLPLTNLGLIFAVGAVLQVLIILWFLFLKHQKQIKKFEQEFFNRRERKPK